MSDSRQYPSRPIVGVGGVIVAGGRVALIRRRFDPLAGRWSIPGGAQETGETLEAALARELREETGLDVEVGPVLDVFDRITRDAEGRAQYHFVLIDYLCRPARDPGTADAGTTDAGAAAAPDRIAPAAAACTEAGGTAGPRGPALSGPTPTLVDPLPACPPLTPSSDVSDAVWADPDDLARFDLTERTEAVVRAGLARLTAAPITWRRG